MAVCIDSGDTLVDESTEVKKGHVVQTADLFPGAAEHVAGLRRAGMKLALVADGRLASFENILCQHELLDHFDALAVSDEVGATKPQAEPFEAAMRQLAIDKIDYFRVVMVGNRLDRDVKGANRLGMISVWFRGGSGPYLDHPSDEDERPAYEARSWAEVSEIIRDLHENFPGN